MRPEQLNILLADDDFDDCALFSRALSELPLFTSLKIVSDGEELMRFLTNEESQLPHVLFLDINMPRKNGNECLAEIKRNIKLKDLPVVIFSTSSSQDAISHLFKEGANLYVRKPGDFSQLKKVIHHAIPIASEPRFVDSRLKYILNA